jgi:hypothetical protein
LSTSTLSLKIFRSKFLKHNIPILNHTTDNFIREGYFGGATDYYLKYGENLTYYDVNSLYPYSMCKPMPFEIIKFHKDMNNMCLEDFFGYCLVEVQCPQNIKIPLLPYKYNDKIIFPKGNWIGTYFSEELKEVVKHGYSIKLISGYSFSKIDLFSEYVNHFYAQKIIATGPKRFIAKMHLNQLYGYLGRKLDLIETKNIFMKDLPKYFSTRILQSIIKINSNICTILMSCNLDYDLITKLNTELNININNSFKSVKSNVAIASAVTSYSRIEMIKYKTLTDYQIYYTDTDSIFIDKPYISFL